MAHLINHFPSSCVFPLGCTTHSGVVPVYGVRLHARPWGREAVGAPSLTRSFPLTRVGSFAENQLPNMCASVSVSPVYSLSNSRHHGQS